MAWTDEKTFQIFGGCNGALVSICCNDKSVQEYYKWYTRKAFVIGFIVLKVDNFN